MFGIQEFQMFSWLKSKDPLSILRMQDQSLDLFLTQHLEGRRLNLEKLDLTQRIGHDELIINLVKLIKINSPLLKEIRTARIQLSAAQIELLKNTLAENTHITQFAFHYQNATLEQERAIKQQLLLNKGLRKYFKPLEKRSVIDFLYMQSVLATLFSGVLAVFLTGLPLIGATLGTLMAFELTRRFYHSRVQNNGLSLKKSTSIAQTVQASTTFNSGFQCSQWHVLPFLNPKSYLPLASLSYQIGKHALPERYGLTASLSLKNPSKG